MRVCIHRGTQEIGGTCIELEQNGFRIVLDIGLPLDCEDPDNHPLPLVSGFQEADSTLLAVIISHPHQDHYGLAGRLPESTNFFIGESAAAMLSAAINFSPSGLSVRNRSFLKDRIPVSLGPFTVTPFLMDHSAYDSYSLLIEAGGHRLFYSADVRAHGRKQSVFEKLISEPPLDVDVLIMEGTTLLRPTADGDLTSEAAVEDQMTEIFGATKGLPLVWSSGQNIDRLVSIFRACKSSNRQLIVDMYTAAMLRATGNPRVPQAEWDGVRVFLPAGQKRRIIALKAFDVSDSFRNFRIFPEEIAAVASSSVMLIRPSMTKDLDNASCLKDGCVVCSVWPGYLENESNQRFVKWMERHSLPLFHCHTSGHATEVDLKRLRNAFASAVVVPVHLTERDYFQSTFHNSRLVEDGQWWEVNGMR